MNRSMNNENQELEFFFEDFPEKKTLIALAFNMRWGWYHGADDIWKRLDSDLWEQTHNPWIILQTVSLERIKAVVSDPSVQKKMKMLLADHEMKKEAWFNQQHAGGPLTGVAYFSMEYMLSEALPIYSGGLGNVAGDQLKAAENLGVPVIGIGLLYQQGYFRQVIDKDGRQQALYPFNDPGQLPVVPLRKADGEWLRLKVTLPDYVVWLRCWQVLVGSVRLYLLDSNDAANFPAHRGITSELYGGGVELRLKQELLLGIGGWRLLEELGLHPEVCHLNEGHAAFAVLERAFSYMKATGNSFKVALAVTRAGNLFTTHTAVPAGFDRFSPDLIEQYLGRYAREKLRITMDELLALGRLHAADPSEPFNMAYLAIHGCNAVNGVSNLHGQVSRRLFQPLFPRWPQHEVPVGHITNGVHVQSWDSAAADELWTEACGKDRWKGILDTLVPKIRQLPDERLWQMRCIDAAILINYTRKRLSLQRLAAGAAASEVEEACRIFDPDALTLGFARRFAGYKRPNLLLQDPQRLQRMLTNREHPVQLIIAGKAHPADGEGQEMIRQWTRFIQQPEVRASVVFLSDYDVLLTEKLVQGVDVWINTPRRPWEACGTSGMKVLVNGGLNISELDGWWAEAYHPAVGWALGDGQEHGDDPAWDRTEANQLYELLENEVIPAFYDRNNDRIPVGWVARMRESMARLAPAFSANRAVREYTERYYLPAAEAYKQRSNGDTEIARHLVQQQELLQQKWPAIHFGKADAEQKDQELVFNIQVYLGDIDPELVQVELYADGINGGEATRKIMEHEPDNTAMGAYIYRTKITTMRPVTDYTPRIIPGGKSGLIMPLEAHMILWQH